LKDRDESFEAHACVDVFIGEGPEGSVCFAIVLNEDVVPDFEDIGIVLVHEMGSISAADSVVMEFCTWTTWTLITHFFR
jgi:hypothetical protein